MDIGNEPTDHHFDAYGRDCFAAFKRGCDVTYEQCADEIADLKEQIADLKKKLAAAYAEDKPDAIAAAYRDGFHEGAVYERGTQRDTPSPTWSETYAETLSRHSEDEAVS